MQPKILFPLILSLAGCSGEAPLTQAPPPASPALEVAAPIAAAEPPVSGPASSSAPSQMAPSEGLVQKALAEIGVAYRRGGESPGAGFDCSGLIVHVYREALGLTLPHNTLAQSKVGRPVLPGQMRPGDLVFYNTRHRKYSHVGLYVGEGRFIHAPKPGASVRIERMSVGYWARRFDGARRVDTQGSPVVGR